MNHGVAAQPLTLDQARDTLEAHVRTTWWRRRGIAKALNVSSFTLSGAWHVAFESFTESRTTADAHQPYEGGHEHNERTKQNGLAPRRLCVGTSPALDPPRKRERADDLFSNARRWCARALRTGSIFRGVRAGSGAGRGARHVDVPPADRLGHPLGRILVDDVSNLRRREPQRGTRELKGRRCS